jgi:hypothetical protein
MNRQESIKQGLKTYEGKSCKHCGSTIRYVSSMNCRDCGVKSGLAKLNNEELMAPYRTKEKKKDWVVANPIKVKSIKKRYKDNNKLKLSEYYKMNKDVWREGQLKRHYGLTIEQYDDILSKQNGKCAICGTDSCSTGKQMAVDHNHETGEIRGILCAACNIGIGMMKDDVSLIRKALTYLERF